MRRGALNGGLRASVLRHAESATVRLLMGSPAEAATSGSGTLISPTGLILTNTHVAAGHARACGGLRDPGIYFGTMTPVGRWTVLTCLAGPTGHCRPRAVRWLCALTPILRGLCAPAPATR
jgi:hypothetical protein